MRLRYVYQISTLSNSVIFQTNPYKVVIILIKIIYQLVENSICVLVVKTYLRVVLQDDGDVHVDDDKEADDKIGKEEGDAHGGVTAVAGLAGLVVVLGTILLINDAV